MRSVGVRELKNNATKIVRAVREEQAEYIVTVGGRPVAVLRPVTGADVDEWRQGSADPLLDALDELTTEVSESWSSPDSAVDAVRGQRR
jgi:prevent-host-death family protein